MQMAIIHRPHFPDTCPEETARKADSGKIDIYNESIWIITWLVDNLSGCE
jgi:hypothetical protein